jgi:hypothetical protein
MLQASHKKAYQELLTLLRNFEKSIFVEDIAAFINIVPKEFQKLQQFFQEQILSLTSEVLDRDISPRWQSWQTEMQREFRLLNTDILFLGSSRQLSTQEVRLKSIRDRFLKLIAYTEAILNL